VNGDEGHWAELRQIGFATLDHTAATKTATELLELGPSFGDPMLGELHLADFTVPVGLDTYLEVLAPTAPDHSIARWLRRVGGSSGWVLSTQVPSVAGVAERAAEHGVRVAVQTQAMGHDVIQLHPLDVGVLLELDQFLPRGGWFWDDLPGAQAARDARSPKVDDIMAVDVAVEDPPAMAATWAAIIGLEPPAGPELMFGHRPVRFVPAQGRSGIVAVDLHATNRDRVPGQRGVLCNTLIRFV